MGAIALLFMIVGYALSWIATCGLVYLVTLCLGLTYSWLVASTVWLIALFLKWIFGGK